MLLIAFRFDQDYADFALFTVAAEGIFGWGCKHFPRTPRQHGPPVARALFYFYAAVSTDNGAFLDRIRVHRNSRSLVTVQTLKLKAYHKRPSLPLPEATVRRGPWPDAPVPKNELRM